MVSRLRPPVESSVTCPPVQSQVLAISPGPAGLSEGRGFIDGALSAAGFDAEARYQITVATNEAMG